MGTRVSVFLYVQASIVASFGCISKSWICIRQHGEPTGESRVGNIIDLVMGNPFSVSGLSPGVGANGKGEDGEEGRDLHVDDQEGME
jgi:hypothetical protein